jgi:hypothetical protein
MFELITQPIILLKMLISPAFFPCMSIIMFIFLEIGRRIRLSSSAKQQIKTRSSINGPVETIIFALLGLLLAFTFTGAGTRYEARRQLIGTEANVIGTAYLRINFLPKELQPQMRSLFKQYIQLRADVYKKIADPVETSSRMDKSEILQKQMWDLALTGCNLPEAPNECSRFILPSINEIVAISITRSVAQETHPPTPIYLLLIILSLFSAILVGYSLPHTNRRNLLYMISYAVIISLILFQIADIEMPRQGWITINEADHIISDLLHNM